LKTEHNLGLKNYALGVSASRTLIIPKEKNEKKRKPYRQGENEADARFLPSFFE
jgi:hypothetical protein